MDKIRIKYFRGSSPTLIVLNYNKDGLIKKTEFNLLRKSANWEEVYVYEDSKVHMTKKYFITYWGVIPPTEKWTTELDSYGRETKVIRELAGIDSKEILYKTYNEIGNIVRLTLTKNDSERIFDYLVSYK